MTCTENSLSDDDFYASNIINGSHGNKYQQDLALVMFERATRKEYDFRLGYEMEIADKFDDVTFFNKIEKQWTLVQAKHADTSKGKPPIRFEMLFPTDEATREKGDFSLFKYLKSYVTVQGSIKERKSIIIFSNRDIMEDSLGQSVEVETRQVDTILAFPESKHIGFKVKDPLLKEMLDYVNRDFNSLRDSIVKLFRDGIINPTIKNFKTPVASILTKTKDSVKFSENHSQDACQMIESLSSVIDIQTVQLPLSKCKSLFTGKSRNKTWPLSVKEKTVQQFFEDLILSVRQPDDLRSTINHDLRLWMRTWIQPDYFRCLEESQLDISTIILEEFFNNKQSSGKKVNEDRSFKRFLQRADGIEFFETVKQDLETQISNLSIFNANETNELYINRQIAYEKHTDCNSDSGSIKMKIRDVDFVKELSGDFDNQRFILLTAEPGMGKSTILKFIAMKAQQTSNDCVYLFKLNTFNQKLAQMKQADSFGQFLTILGNVLSKKNASKLKDVFNGKDNTRKHFLVFDALDEVFPKNRKIVLDAFLQMLTVQNVKILVSARRTVKTMVEKQFTINAMSLVPYDERDQMDFLRQFWIIPDAMEGRFRKYVSHLFSVFHTDINRALCEFTGLPLMLKMLAEVYADQLKACLTSEQNDLETLLPQGTFSTIELYEKFVSKCFDNKMMKKSVHLQQDIDEEYDSLFKRFTFEHQLLAIQLLQIVELEEKIFKDDKRADKHVDAHVDKHVNKHVEKLQEFKNRIISGTDRSPLVEAVNKEIRFIHLSYAEFLVAKLLFEDIEDYETEIFGMESRARLFYRFPMIRLFFFAMIEERCEIGKQSNLEILEKHYKMNSDIALWACEVHGQKIVRFVLRTTYGDSNITAVLSKAAEYNCFNICSYLLTNHQLVLDGKDNIVFGALLIAAEKRHMSIFDLLMEYIGDVNKARDSFGWTFLHFVAQKGQSEVVTMVIEKIAEIDATDNSDRTTLHIVAENGHTEIVKILIENGGDVNAKEYRNWTPLHYAAEKNHSEIAQILIDNTADVNARANDDQRTPLHIAVEEEHLEIVKMLIDSGADRDAKRKDNWTPLHIASQKGNTGAVKLLLGNGTLFGNVYARTNEGWTALHFAARFGHLEIVELLIANGGDVNVTENDNCTSLHFAAKYGHTDVVKAIIKLAENVDARSSKGWTPLHHAAKNGHLEIVKIFTENSANIKARNNNGMTPYMVAKFNGQSDVAKLLPFG